MVYVNQKQLDQVEYILEQSTHGHHILFDNDDIRRIFNDAKSLRNIDKVKPQAPASSKNSDKGPSDAEKHIENLILQPTILSKRTYLENLAPEMYEEVVRTYFSIVENNIFEDMEYRH